MWKLALISLAVAFSTTQGRTLGVESWNRMLAEIMQSANSGTCEAKVCFVRTGGRLIALESGQQHVEGCTVYMCTPSEVRQNTIKCPQNIVCADGEQTITYPGSCCKQCEGQRNEIGIFTEWEEWTPCSATCGGGRRARKRECRIDITAGFVECTGTLLETEDCNTHGCPVPCRWEYGDYGSCSATCGDGTKERIPRILQSPQNGGEPCPPFVENQVPDVAPCNIQPCEVPCRWEWGEYDDCSKSCGTGTRTRYPRIITQAEHGGFCPEHVLNREPDTAECNTNPCPVPCVWEWGEYEDCSVTCGGGTQTRVPRIITPAKHGGECPLHVLNGVPEKRECNTPTCPPICPDPNDNNCLINGVYKCIYDPDKDCVVNDNCEFIYNPLQKDMDRDDAGDVCDNCKFYRNPEQMNSDDDETGDACDPDDDNDGVVDQEDNCITVNNRDQRESDRDGVGDACDNCPKKKNTNQADIDKDGVGNACDNCRYYPNPEQHPGDQAKYGTLCTTRPSGVEIEEDEYDEMFDKKGLAAEIMEKLMELYYSK